MPLTKQQLLIPRVLCIGGKDGDPNYPGSRFMTGDIIEKNGRDYWSVKADAWLNQTTVEKFPHLFRPMPWWEGRTVEDLPEFVKDIEDGNIHKSEFVLEQDGDGFFWNLFIEGESCPLPVEDYQPASISDWEAQQTKEA